MVSLKTKTSDVKEKNTDVRTMKWKKKPMILNPNWKYLYDIMMCFILKKNPVSVYWKYLKTMTKPQAKRECAQVLAFNYHFPLKRTEAK